MAQEFLLPDPGEGIHEAEVLEIHVSPGDEVKDGDPLFSVETDKAVVEVPSSFDGQIEDVPVGVGEMVEVGSVLLTYTALGEPSPGKAKSSDVDSSAKEESETGAEEKPSGRTRPGGRKSQPPVPASPATRSLAKRLGVDLHEIEGSGPEGRIEPGDVQAAARETEEARRPGPAGQREEAREPEPREEEAEWVALRSVRRATARQMTKSWNEIPHVSHHDVADITELEQLRQDHAKEIEESGGKLSLTVFLVKAVAAALADHPRFNTTLDMENERVLLRSQVNMGVAVDTEDGLVVPVIEDVAHKSIAEVAVELPEVSSRMRSGERSLDDMQGGTFTITNPGGIGGTSFNPIINHPEVAILGAARARRVPVFADGGEVVGRLHLPLVLAFDHRVNDGADAARFMNTIKLFLEDPSRMILRV